MRVRRDIILFVTVAVAAVATGWWLLANRPGGGVEAFLREERARENAARPHLPPAEAFRATICADQPCVVVEAGGLTFLFGAGRDAAEGIRSLGLMHANVDAVLLPDLSLSVVEGLPAIAAASAAAGRREALRVFGPSGLVPVVDGANLMAAGSGSVRLSPGTEGEDQGASGRVLFDSGVVAIRGFGGRETGTGRVYRVDFDDRSLILAGCLAQVSDVVAAAREAKTPGGVLLAGARALSPGRSGCVDISEVVRGAGQARLAAWLIVPAEPPASVPGAIAAWSEVLRGVTAPGGELGLKGARIDLAGDAPRTVRAP